MPNEHQISDERLLHLTKETHWASGWDGRLTEKALIARELLELRQESASAERRGIEKALEAINGLDPDAIRAVEALLPSADETEPTK